MGNSPSSTPNRQQQQPQQQQWSLLSPVRTAMEASTAANASDESDEKHLMMGVPSEKPPTYTRPQSFEEKLYSKFMKQPLVPIGCLTTAYFLMSGIKSFKNRDPRRAQKMMRARVGAQFFTLIAFVGYMGFDSFNMEAAPAYKRHKEIEKWEEEERAKQQQEQQQQRNQPQQS